MEQHIQNIKEACIAANPEIASLPPYPYNPDEAKAIIELEKITQKTLWNETLEKTATIYIENYRQQQAGDYRAMLEKRWEGRPIRLADVLLAININTDEGIYILDDGTFADREDIVLGNWNLRKDSLTEQSPECLEFISNLLTN